MGISKIHDGSHFMKVEEQQMFYQFIQAGNYARALPFLRKVWREKADMHFLRKFTMIHWAQPNNLVKMLNVRKSEIEICCQAYLKPPYKCGWVGGVGIIVDGEITLAGNADLQTNQWSSLTNQDGKKYTEYASRLFVNAKTYKTPYEFIVYKWTPKIIVIDENSVESWNKDQKAEVLTAILELSRQQNLQILDINGDKYFK